MMIVPPSWQLPGTSPGTGSKPPPRFLPDATPQGVGWPAPAFAGTCFGRHDEGGTTLPVRRYFIATALIDWSAFTLIGNGCNVTAYLVRSVSGSALGQTDLEIDAGPPRPQIAQTLLCAPLCAFCVDPRWLWRRRRLPSRGSLATPLFASAPP
jgi:hypothetical protein